MKHEVENQVDQINGQVDWQVNEQLRSEYD
jgi:hypothetical protein